MNRITTRSRRQAMDWSLVLVSQGIETVIEQSEDGTGWGLVVDARDYERAVSAIRQYRAENRHWPWRQQTRWPGLLFDWTSVVWCLALALFYWFGETRAVDLRSNGAMDNAAVSAGQWWRLFTAITLHADVAHLVANVTIGFVLLGLTMGRYGTGVGLLAAVLAGAGGNVADLIVYHAPHRSLGASGMILGCLGLLAAQSMSLWRQHPLATKYVVSSVLAGIMLFVLFGLTPGTDVVAHFGGFATGLLLGGILAHAPTKFLHNPKINLVSGTLVAALMMLVWGQAMGRLN
ncbi:MAG: rhomboid family intramembrane serine protease [Verrucomicrobia bacterium]|nr:rhomboid family intramembrane serine protease [Verrucomicrobiota bacterium]